MDLIVPNYDEPADPAAVAELSANDRERRIFNLIDQAFEIYHSGVAELQGKRQLVASCILFSGGNDSTTLAHLFKETATHAIHANTTIGIEQTRQFVRDRCAEWELPLIEKRAPVSFRELVIERGFPGPAMHWKMYSRLKERALDLARRDLGIANSRSKCAVFIAGRRRSESDRRANVPLWERDGTVIWVSPFAFWTKPDLNTYRTLFSVPRNEVSDLLHMSGECLCGSFAKPGELDEIEMWFPEVAAEIRALEEEVRAAGFTDETKCRWGNGKGQASKVGPMCSSCDSRFTPVEEALVSG